MKKYRQKVKTITKRDIVRLVAAACKDDLSTTAKRVDEVFCAIREVLMSADPSIRIEIRDFGVFEVKETRSKPKARNPKSGDLVYVPAHRKTHFKPSKLLKKFLTKPIEGDPVSAPGIGKIPENG